MEALPYYKWFWQDYRANRRVQRMPWQARGPYRDLLDEFWAEGSLPMDHAELADICAMLEAEFEQWWPYISPHWEEREGRLYNAKMDQQRTATDAARVAMSQGGKAGGKVSNSSTRGKVEKAYLEATLKEPEREVDIEEKRRVEKSSKPDLPEWLPDQDWTEYLKMRKSKKSPLTAYAETLRLKELIGLHEKGYDALDLLRQSIANCWLGFVMEKAKKRPVEWIPVSGQEFWSDVK
jgi:uncharacterized protein YdaU (DUF1376 family)